jgi:hypothetical protein
MVWGWGGELCQGEQFKGRPAVSKCYQLTVPLDRTEGSTVSPLLPVREDGAWSVHVSWQDCLDTADC